jgi:hypothetical protein
MSCKVLPCGADPSGRRMVAVRTRPRAYDTFMMQPGDNLVRYFHASIQSLRGLQSATLQPVILYLERRPTPKRVRYDLPDSLILAFSVWPLRAGRRDWSLQDDALLQKCTLSVTGLRVKQNRPQQLPDRETTRNQVRRPSLSKVLLILTLKGSISCGEQ